ncbi:DUF6491 family protein [Cognatilysobacter lacus]|uniref:Lipoprotein n=1 Tax=Cognatilysobacter lacus TaxID=1643323 RepID=A0A5D8Z0L7_9GAMM|nr:DUF6491 family protein [Lysobacter lacus]TZF88269.1 hypothetical protein FW784_10110 [Lysobacter lacus]
MRPSVLVPLVAAALLAGCATSPAMQPAAQLALYSAHAGPPVPDFPYYRTLTQWTPLGRDALAVWVSPSRAYLLDVPGCTDLEWAHGIRISNTVGRVSARFDRVQPIGGGSSGITCRIEQIRPLDTKAIRDAEKLERGKG